MNTDYDQVFVNYLLDLKKKENRGALAALRSGLGKKPGESTLMFPYIARFLPHNADPGASRVQSIFLTASLFATHPEHKHSDSGADAERKYRDSLGASLRKAVEAKHGEEGVSKRLVAALDAHPDDLARHLAGLVSLCESARVPIDWIQFRKDAENLLSTNEDWRDKTRLRWARGFWASATANDSHTPEGENS